MSFRVRWSGLLLGLACLSTTASAAVETAGGWPGLRGPNHDGAVREARLIQGAGPAALTVTWKQDLGSGYSGVAAAGDRVVTMFAAGAQDVASAFDAATGKEIWRYPIAEAYKGHDGSHDGPISSPLIHASRVYGLGPRGQLFALELATGKPVWVKDLVAEHGAKAPFYGFTTSPIMVDGVLIVELGAGEGKAIGGFKPADGSLLWSAGDDTIDYHSPIAATIGGKLQVLAAGGKTLKGIDAASGKVLWNYEHQGDEAATGGATIIPVPCGDGRFLLLNKADSSAMVKVQRDGNAWKVEQLWSTNSIRGTYVIPVYLDGYIYGVTGRIFTCVDAATGETKWRSREPGDGFPTLVGKQLVIITKPGTMHVADASPEGYHELLRLDLFQQHSWAAVAYDAGHLYARSMGHIARVDIGAAPAEPGGSRDWVTSTAFGRFLEDAAKSADRKAAVDTFMAAQKSLPIVEDSGAVHFVYRGEAKDVGIVGDMVGFRREDPMTRLEGTDLFHYSVVLEPDAAVNYGFIVDYGKPIADPRNPRPGRGLFGEVSFLPMPAWRDMPYTTEAPADRQGKLEDFEWESAVREGKKRQARIYLPTGYAPKGDRRYPVMFVHDGKDALEQGLMKNVLDHLIGVRVEPLVAVFIMPDPNNPNADRAEGDKYAEMVMKELVPAIDARYATRTDAVARAMVGITGGANNALTLVFANPQMFGRVGSLAATVMNAEEFRDKIPARAQAPLVVYQRWGTYHLRSPHEAWDMGKGNQGLWALLRERGQRPTGGEAPFGFGWGCFRPHLGEMVEELFPLAPSAGATGTAASGS
jgi:enterochelin esterase-like enzyme/outer membrane protein assembly factor BamB